MTPHGLEIRLSWGDHVLAEHFLPPARAASFTVGSAPGCEFAMRDLAGPRFEVARAGPDGFELRFASWMAGEVSRGDDCRELSELISVGEAMPDGEGYAVALEGDASARVELGEITLQAAVRPCPALVAVPFVDTIDFRTLNIVLVLFALVGGFAVSALNRQVEGDEYADDLAVDGPRLARLIVKPAPAVQPAPVVQRPGKEAQEGAQQPARKPGSRPRASPRVQAQSLANQIFGADGKALFAVLGEGTQAGGGLQEAIRGLRGSGGTAALDTGFGGLGLRGTGTGGTPGGPYLIGAIGMKGRRGSRDPVLRSWTCTAITCPFVRSDPVLVADPTINGAIDQELVRAVIKSHRNQIRYCYERELARDPALSGKLVTKFVIGSEGLVTSSHVAESSMKSADLDLCVNSRVQSWVFPKPKGGGSVVVSYPFVFTQSGV